MTASLILAGYEMLGGTTNPEYRLAPGFDFGAGEPDQTTITSLYLDGDTVSSDRTRNRVVTLPITVRGGGAQGVAANVSTLLQAISADTFTMQWTPDGGLPLIFDCYRAVWSRPERSLVKDAQGLTSLLLSFQAKPFGRSPDVQSVTVVASTQIDSFDSAPTGATLSTTNKVEGSGSAVLAGLTGTVSRSFAAKNLSAATQARLWEQVTKTGMGIQTYNVTLTLTLTSAGGSTRYTAQTFAGTVGAAWSLRAISLANGTVTAGTGVSLAAVTSYSLAYSYAYSTAVGAVGTKTQYLDDFEGAGAASTLVGPTTHAAVLAVPVSVGSARTPVNLALSNGSSIQGFLLHSPPEDQDALAQILTSLSAASADQTITIAALNGNFRGTYGLYLAVDTLGVGGITATITVTQQQNGVNVGTAKVLTKTYTAGPRIIAAGEVTLPLYDVPSDNNTTGYTVRVQVTSTARYSELMLCDTRGQTVYTDGTGITAAANIYLDEPSALQSAPAVYAGASRAVAFGVLGNCWMTGGPAVFEPGINKLLAWVDTATPVVTMSYYPRWIDERVS